MADATDRAAPASVSGAAERHRRHLERFLAEGRLVGLTTRYAVVVRALGPDEDRWGIGCLRCGALSWSWNDVEARYCARWKRWHEDG